MDSQSSMRGWADELFRRVRGVFATESNRRVAFWARSLFQPSEILARTRRARELEAELLPELRVPEADGYLRLPASVIPDLNEIADAGREIASATIASSSTGPAGKAFHRNRLAEGAQLQALLRIAVDRRMVAMAASYLGVLPVLGDVDYFLSLPSAKPWARSQLWHCDDDAPRQLKVFIYCGDVGENDGPLEMIGASDSRDVRDAIGYRYAGRRYRVSDELMDKHLSRDKQLSIRGAHASAFAVDTARCFHKGSRITSPSRRRMVAMILYCTPNGIRLPLRLTRHPGPYASAGAQHTGALERAVLGYPLT